MTVHVSAITKRVVIPANNDCWYKNNTDMKRINEALERGIRSFRCQKETPRYFLIIFLNVAPTMENIWE